MVKYVVARIEKESRISGSKYIGEPHHFKVHATIHHPISLDTTILHLNLDRAAPYPRQPCLITFNSLHKFASHLTPHISPTKVNNPRIIISINQDILSLCIPPGNTSFMQVGHC